MDFEFVVNANTIIGFVGIITAIGVLIGLIKNSIHQIDRWNSYDDKINKTTEKINGLKEEQYVQTKVLLAVLDGLHQQGCNGKVTKATEDLTEYLNKSTHSNGD